MRPPKVATCPSQDKPYPHVLSDDETFRLMNAFTKDKTEILEEDAMALARWANKVKWEYCLLTMVLEGELLPSVKDGRVSLARPCPIDDYA